MGHWEYFYELKKPQGRRTKWSEKTVISEERMTTGLPKVLSGGIESGVQVNGWRFNRRYRRFTIFAVDGTTHILRWVDE